ncbi:MAG: efflux RND transporter periplasmic adaptor subunit [Bacteroidales bacterium]
MDRVLERKKGLQRKHILPLAGGGLFVALLVWMVLGSHGQTVRVDRDKLLISKVISGEFKEYIRLTGTVLPNSVIMLSPSEAGRVEEIVAEEGSQLKAGDVIVRLSNPSLGMTVINSEAQLAEKENFLRNTLIQMQQNRIRLQQELLQQNFDVQRKKRRFENNSALRGSLSNEEYLLSKEDYEYALQSYQLMTARHAQDSIFAEVQLKQLEEGLDNMKRNLAMVRQRLDELEVKAPIDGQLGMLDVEMGQNLGAGQKIGQMTGGAGFKLEVLIDESYIDRVHSGLPVRLERQSESYEMRIRKIYPEVRQGAFKADLVFTGSSPDNLRNGQSHTLLLELGLPAEAVMIPKGPFFQTTGGQSIFVLSANGREAVMRTIRIGRQNPQYYEVIEGLTPGEEVITSGYEMFGKNTRVELR